MTIEQAVLFGLLQGVTEFLPVSSSGHLALLKIVFRLEDVPLLFDVLLHVSTLLVVLVVFRERIIRILAGFGRTLVGRPAEGDREQVRLAGIIVLATALTGVIGLGVTWFDPGENPDLVSVCFLITAVALLVGTRRAGTRSFGELRVRDAVAVGIAQGVGVLPGVSRSGITIAAGLGLGLKRAEAGELSFLLAVPAILGALVLKLRDAGDLLAAVPPHALAAGMIAAAAAGIASLVFLLTIVRRGDLWWFSFYLVPLGLAGIIFL